jgi:hypothetical protein
MYRINAFDAFQFDNYQVLDKQIDAVAEVNSLTIVNNRKFNLPSDLQPIFATREPGNVRKHSRATRAQAASAPSLQR